MWALLPSEKGANGVLSEEWFDLTQTTKESFWHIEDTLEGASEGRVKKETITVVQVGMMAAETRMLVMEGMKGVVLKLFWSLMPQDLLSVSERCQGWHQGFRSQQ